MGKRISSPKLDINEKDYDSISAGFCTEQKKETGDPDDFAIRGGLKQMGKALGRGMVLVMSLWDDAATDMLWLDSTHQASVAMAVVLEAAREDGAAKAKASAKEVAMDSGARRALSSLSKRIDSTLYHLL